MKAYTFALALFGLMPIVANGAPARSTTSNVTRSASKGKVNTYRANNTSRKTGGYKNTITNNFFTTNRYSGVQPSGPARTAGNTSAPAAQEPIVERRLVGTKKKTVKKTFSSQERKYFLAHPFFQPLKGKFGSSTDASYASSTMDVTLLNAEVFNIDTTSANPDFNTPFGVYAKDLGATMSTTQFMVKEDVSFGVSDTLAVQLVAAYDSTKNELKNFSDGSKGDTWNNSGLNVFGFGLQTRFADNADYIGMLGAQFIHTKDAANTIAGELKIGTKVGRVTAYGMVRGSYSNLTKTDIYGIYVNEDESGDWLIMSYNTNKKDIFMGEGGLGAFGVFNKYMTLKGELTLGYYDWHNQATVRGEFGIQPGDKFALNAYAQYVVYDSAKNMKRNYYNYDVNPDTSGFPTSPLDMTDTKLVFTQGEYKINSTNEWKVGIQGILYF